MIYTVSTINNFLLGTFHQTPNIFYKVPVALLQHENVRSDVGNVGKSSTVAFHGNYMADAIEANEQIMADNPMSRNSNTYPACWTNHLGQDKIVGGSACSRAALGINCGIRTLNASLKETHDPWVDKLQKEAVAVPNVVAMPLNLTPSLDIGNVPTMGWSPDSKIAECTIFFKIQGVSVSVRVNLDQATISDTLAALPDKYRAMVKQAYFVHRGKRCRDKVPMAKLGIDKWSTVHAIGRGVGGMPDWMAGSADNGENLPSVEEIRQLDDEHRVMELAQRFNEILSTYPRDAQPVDLFDRRQACFDRAIAIRSSMREELLEARAARREAERCRREAEERANEGARRLANAQARQRLPFIAELTEAEYATFVHALGDHIEALWPKPTREVNNLLPHGWREMLYQVCDAHRAQVYPAEQHFNERRVKVTKVGMSNGDFQRGKSTVEALFCLINYAIHCSTSVGDVCCTAVYSQLRAWSLALADTMQSKTAREAPPDDDELVEEENGVAAIDLGDLPIARLGGHNGRAVVKKCLQAGGAAVFFRTGPQYGAFSKMLAEINDSRTRNEKAFVSTLVLDEGDKFFADPRADHARQLLQLMGIGGPRQRNCPVLVVCVSATNIGPCYYFWRRMHLTRGQPIEIDDIVGFAPAEAISYRHETRSVLPAGEAIQVPRPDGEYVTPQILEQWWRAMHTDYALILDTATVRVNYGVITCSSTSTRSLFSSWTSTMRCLRTSALHGSLRWSSTFTAATRRTTA